MSKYESDTEALDLENGSEKSINEKTPCQLERGSIFTRFWRMIARTWASVKKWRAEVENARRSRWERHNIYMVEDEDDVWSMPYTMERKLDG